MRRVLSATTCLFNFIKVISVFPRPACRHVLKENLQPMWFFEAARCNITALHVLFSPASFYKWENLSTDMFVAFFFSLPCVSEQKRAFPHQQINTPDPFWFVKSNRHGFEESRGRLTGADLARLHRTHSLLSSG